MRYKIFQALLHICKKITILLLFYCFFNSFSLLQAYKKPSRLVIQPKASNQGITFVTSCYSGGRFGDNLVAIARTLFFALKNNYIFVIKPFPFMESLVIDDCVLHMNQVLNQKPCNTYVIKQHDTTHTIKYIKDRCQTLFFVPYEAEDIMDTFSVDWSDPYFLKTLKKLIQPKKKLSLICPPQNNISVALHVRTGGGYDSEIIKTLMPTRFIQYDFYVNALKKIDSHFNHQPLYVFLFTDHTDPHALLQFFEEQVGIPTITFDCRTANTGHDKNVLEDFFSLQNFDCLIRPESHFSIMAEKLGNFKIVVSPSPLLSHDNPLESSITHK